ncbi:MAG: CmpA/NrtA family ABC transporter substrate-binding protein [Rubrivivax sp.]
MTVASVGRPEKEQLRIGFMRLTDCAPIVMASVLGFDRRHGIQIVPTREASWAGVRDKLAGGELDLAHALYGLVYGLHLGIGGPRKDMAVLMGLNRNGQGITLSRALVEAGALNPAELKRLVVKSPYRLTLAQTFPTGTHAMWLYYWLAAAGLNPWLDLKVITMPPPQMVAALRAGQVDGFSAGEPWNQRAVIDGVGVSAVTSQQIWQDHPEKVLGCSADFADRHPHSARAAVSAVLEAARWIDASTQNKARTAETLAAAEYIDTSVDAILPRLLGAHADGTGHMRVDEHPACFFDGGAVNFPYLSDGMWFMTQYRRWGLIAQHPDYLAVAQRINRVDLYRDAAAALGADVPTDTLRRSTLIDGVVWDGRDPAAYADAFAIHARADAAHPA